MGFAKNEIGIYNENTLLDDGNISPELQINMEATTHHQPSGGIFEIMSETIQNDYSCFSDSMIQEMSEIKISKYLETNKDTLIENGIIEEGALDNIQVVMESEEGFGAKLKKGASVFWQKIQGILNNLATKIQSLFAIDYGKFYSKHEAAFKAKIGKNVKFKLARLKKPLTNTCTGAENATKAAMSLGNINNAKNLESSINDGSYLTSILGCPKNEYAKKMKDEYFEEVKEYDNVTSGLAADIQNTMNGGKALVEAIKKSKEQQNKIYTDSIKSVDRAIKKFKSGKSSVKLPNSNKEVTYAKDSEEYASASGNLSIVSKQLKVLQRACMLMTNTMIGLVKFHLAQCKAAFTRIVTAKETKAEDKDSKKATEESALLDMVAECVFDDTLIDLDNNYDVDVVA